MLQRRVSASYHGMIKLNADMVKHFDLLPQVDKRRVYIALARNKFQKLHEVKRRARRYEERLLAAKAQAESCTAALVTGWTGRMIQHKRRAPEKEMIALEHAPRDVRAKEKSNLALVDLQNEALPFLLEAAQLEHAIIQEVFELKDATRTALLYRFVEGLTVEETAKQVGYSEQHTARLMNQSLANYGAYLWQKEVPVK